MKIDDDGWITVTIGGSAAAQIDAYEWHNKLLTVDAAIKDEFPEAPAVKLAGEFQTRVAALLADQFGPVSCRAADKFATALFQAVEDLGKAEAVTPTPV